MKQVNENNPILLWSVNVIFTANRRANGGYPRRTLNLPIRRLIMSKICLQPSSAGNEASVLVSYEELHDRWLLTRWSIRCLLEHHQMYPNDVDGNFPLPIKIGRRNFWKLNAIREWATRTRGCYYHPSHPKWLEQRQGIGVPVK